MTYVSFFVMQDSVSMALDAFVSEEVGLFQVGARSFHLDDCLMGGRDENGNLYPDKTRFPNGITHLIDKAHSLNVSFGIYTCSGTETCVGGRPGSWDHWTQDAKSFASWGVDWVKMDNCNVPSGHKPEEYYPLMGKALNETGRPITFNMCEWGEDDPWNWGYNISQSWRATGDHVGTWESTKSIVTSMAQIPPEKRGRPWGWNDMDMLQTGNGEREAHANGKESNCTEDEWTSEYSMWAINASPLIITTRMQNCTDVGPAKDPCDVQLEQQLSHDTCTKGESYGCYTNGSMWTNNGCRGTFKCNGYNTTCNVDGDGVHVCGCGPVKCIPWITPLQRKLLLNTEVIAINQDDTLAGYSIRGPSDITLWARNLTGGDIAVALFNSEDTPANIGFNFTEIGWSPSTTATVRDLWAHTDNGTAHGEFPPVPVRPHQTIVLRLSPTN